MAGYGTDDGFAAWLISNGYSLPESAPSAAVLRQRGSAYIDGLYAARWPGTPTGGIAQERAWPRVDADTIYGEAITDNDVPRVVIEASYAAAYHEATSPGVLAVAATSAGGVRREKVGSLEVEYFEGSGDPLKDSMPLLSLVEGLLAPLLGGANVPYPLIV